MSSESYAVWQLIDQLSFEVNRFIMGRLWSAGYEDLRLAHSRIFENLGDEGATVTVLAQRAQMTKQSMGELVIDLERLGYVERRTDPSDRRAKLVVLTSKGSTAIQAAFSALDELRALAEQAVGAVCLQETQDMLGNLLSVIRSQPGADR